GQQLRQPGYLVDRGEHARLAAARPAREPAQAAARRVGIAADTAVLAFTAQLDASERVGLEQGDFHRTSLRRGPRAEGLEPVEGGVRLRDDYFPVSRLPFSVSRLQSPIPVLHYLSPNSILRRHVPNLLTPSVISISYRSPS